MRAKVVVSGVGLVGPGLESASALWSVLHEPSAPLPSTHPGVLHDRPQKVYAAGDPGGGAASRVERLALRAVAESIADAGLDEAALATAGVFLGSAQGSIDLFEGHVPLSPEQAKHRLYGLVELLSARYGCCGPCHVFSTACSASLYAIGLAAERIAEGELDLALVGGAEICGQIALACFDRLGGLDASHCRPFDGAREGTVFGEGAAMLVLESEAHFRARRTTQAYGTVDGFGWSCDGHHATAPEPSGGAILAAMHEALTRAGATSAHIGCVVPHGTGTRLNDAVEVEALRRLLGVSLPDTPLLPLKAYVGHGAGAAGAFGCVAAALMCRHRVVPPVRYCVQPEYALRLAPDGATLSGMYRILINGYAFGGNNASLVMGSLS